MKKKISSLFILAGLMLFAVSCSQSEETLVSDNERAIKEAMADASPMLITTPTQLNYTNIPVGSSQEKNVNVKTAGLPSLSMLTAFDVMIQGPDENQFIVEDPELSLAALLQSLLGGGVDIPVTYFPLEKGTHEAELLITATLLGLVMPVQTTVPLHGTSTQQVLRLVRTVPANGGSTTFDGRVPGVIGTPRGQYHLDFVFGQNIAITPDFIAQFNAVTGASIQKTEVVNGNTLRITIWEGELSGTVSKTLRIETGSIVGLNSNAKNADITLTYTVTGGIPNNEVSL